MAATSSATVLATPSASPVSAACTKPQCVWPSTTTSGAPRWPTPYSTLASSTRSTKLPMLRTTNRSPKHRENDTTGCTRESEHATTTAKGCCPSRTRPSRLASECIWWSWMPRRKSALPSSSRRRASAGVQRPCRCEARSSWSRSSSKLTRSVASAGSIWFAKVASCGVSEFAMIVSQLSRVVPSRMITPQPCFCRPPQAAAYLSNRSSIRQPMVRASAKTVSALALLMSLLRCSYIWMERRPTPERRESSTWEQP